MLRSLRQVEREAALKAQAAAEQLQQEVQRLQAEAAEAQSKLADSEVGAVGIHQCCGEASTTAGKKNRLQGATFNCRPRCRWFCGAAGGGEPFEVRDCPGWADCRAQIAAAQGPLNACSGARIASSRREAAAGSRETHG